MEVDMAHFKGTLKVWVSQMCGDNLGLNSILGYAERLSGNSVCHWCHVKKQFCKHNQWKILHCLGIRMAIFQIWCKVIQQKLA